MKVSLIAREVLKCQLLHFESRKSDFPSPREIMPRNTCKKEFWFSFNSKRPQIWDSVSNYHLQGLNKLTRPISVQESAILLFISLCFSVYVNSATFSSSVEIAPKFTFMFIIPKYRGWQNRILEIPLGDYIFKSRGIFVIFQTLFLYRPPQPTKPYFCTSKTKP